MLIHINGFPGVGKLTVARELTKLTAGHLIDNHSVINVVYLATEHGSPEYMELYAELTKALHRALAKNRTHNPLIFTNAQAAELPEDVERHQSYKVLAEERGDVFVPVLLTCAPEANRTRLANPDRAERQKLTRPDVLDDILKKYTPYHPPHPNALTLDTTDLLPYEAAARIKQHCDGLPDKA